jgi:outer membrane protein assembly factor BamE (lipoprotein component of BamABCDE complex)
MQRKRILSAAATVALSFITAGTAMATDFDAWKNDKGNQTASNSRQSLLSEVEKHLRPGMSTQEVVEMLGKPDWTQGNRYFYVLGPTTLGLDESWFVIEFDGNGKLTRHFVQRG